MAAPVTAATSQQPAPGPPGPAQPARHHGLIALLAAVTAAGPLAMQMFLPALPRIAAELQSSIGVTQLTLSLSMVAMALATLFWGPLADRYGRKPALLAGLLVVAAGSLACALAPDIGWLVAGRILQSAGGACGMVVARAVVRDRFGAEGAAAAIAQLTMVMVLAPMIAPLLGGLLIDAIGWRAPFLVVAAFSLVLTLVLALRLQESHQADGETEMASGANNVLRGMALLVSSRQYTGYVLTTAGVSGIFFAFISGTPYLMVDVLGLGSTDYGLWFVAVAGAYMVGNYSAMRLSKSIGQRRTIMAGVLLSVTTVVLGAGVAALLPLSPLVLFVPMAVASMGSGLAQPVAMAAAINCFPRRAGTASGFASFVQMLFAALVTQVVGVTLNGTAWPMIGWMLFSCAVALVAVLVASRRPAGAVP